MRTKGNELRSEAATYAEGTGYTTDQLVTEYESYCEGHECPDDFQRWIERERPDATDMPACK